MRDKHTDCPTRTGASGEMKRLLPVIRKIESYRPAMQALSDDALRAKTDEFKKRLKQGEKEKKLLPEAFAVVREASRRVLGMEPFPVQLAGGIVLYEGRIAEMRTGEGKTLVCVMPAYLAALKGEGVHVVTVNDYLAERDASQMGKVHEFLGLSCGCVLADMSTGRRIQEYKKDITYVTNTELGFDYLRDNLATNPRMRVLRGLVFCIIDEVDSVLIDEARTPLIISGNGKTPEELVKRCDACAKSLTRGEASGEVTRAGAAMGDVVTETGDFIVHEKDQVVTLTEDGIRKAESFFGLSGLSDKANAPVLHGLDCALRANYTLKKDRDYIVRDGEVLIVDAFTGRVLPGRRFSEGLHQAIEAKEGVKIHPETQINASITYQSFFNLYRRKAGMTGTAMTEAQEFRDIYGLDVIPIPTNKPIARIDREDILYRTMEEKYRAIADDIKAEHEKGRPVLVGTTSIESSEDLSRILTEENIPHVVLNAKHPEKEAEIVAKAGETGAVTIATNMAGRGTDIKLDEKARELGGLKVIGTERNESRRIDNQLRGRSGRQGDPGESVFYCSLEDRLFVTAFTKEQIASFAGKGTGPIQDKTADRILSRMQKIIEGRQFASRKDLVVYDEVNNRQRNAVYAERDRVLTGTDVSGVFRAYIADTARRIIRGTVPRKKKQTREKQEETLTRLNDALIRVFPIEPRVMYDISCESRRDLTRRVIRDVMDAYMMEEMQVRSVFGTSAPLRQMERQILLQAIDSHWVGELDDMQHLQQGLSLVGYGQLDPKDIYHIEGLKLFREMMEDIEEDSIRLLFQIRMMIPKPETIEVREVVS